MLSRALDGGRPEIGSDFQQMFDAADALRTARTSRQVTTSPTFLPPGADDRFFIMAAAVFATAPESESGAFRGWITLMYRGADFLGPAVGLIGGDQVRGPGTAGGRGHRGAS